jgi:hypothetical protein
VFECPTPSVCGEVVILSSSITVIQSHYPPNLALKRSLNRTSGAQMAANWGPDLEGGEVGAVLDSMDR